MRRPLNLLGALLAYTLTFPYTVSSEAAQGIGDVSPATSSASGPDAGKQNYDVTVGQVSIP